MGIFTPKGFLQVGGAVLLLVGILGYVGVIGPTADSLFGKFWYFDNAENIAHTVLGIVALGAAFLLKDAGMQKTLVMIVGVLALLVGIYGFISPSLLGANLENPADNILHLVVGAWALAASMKKGEGMMMK
jgi:hypothetical protein